MPSKYFLWYLPTGCFLLIGIRLRFLTLIHSNYKTETLRPTEREWWGKALTVSEVQIRGFIFVLRLTSKISQKTIYRLKKKWDVNTYFIKYWFQYASFEVTKFIISQYNNPLLAKSLTYKRIFKANHFSSQCQLRPQNKVTREKETWIHGWCYGQRGCLGHTTDGKIIGWQQIKELRSQGTGSTIWQWDHQDWSLRKGWKTQTAETVSAVGTSGRKGTGDAQCDRLRKRDRRGWRDCFCRAPE